MNELNIICTWIFPGRDWRPFSYITRDTSISCLFRSCLVLSEDLVEKKHKPTSCRWETQSKLAGRGFFSQCDMGHFKNRRKMYCFRDKNDIRSRVQVCRWLVYGKRFFFFFFEYSRVQQCSLTCCYPILEDRPSACGFFCTRSSDRTKHGSIVTYSYTSWMIEGERWWCQYSWLYSTWAWGSGAVRGWVF